MLGSAHKFIPINKTSSLTQPRAYYSYIFLSCAEPRHEASVCDGWSLHALSVDRCCRSRGIFILPPLSLPTSIFLIHLLQPTSIHLSPPLMILATKLQILVIPCGDWPWERLEKIKLLLIQALGKTIVAGGFQYSWSKAPSQLEVAHVARLTFARCSKKKFVLPWLT
jgi:hypothetical protein